MRKIRTYHDVEHETGSELLEQVVEQRERLARRLAPVGTVVAVASGKGGVGKSAVTAGLAAALAARGHRVGALDADLNGPSLARMLGVSGATLGDGPDGVEPATSPRHGVRVMSMELLQGAEDAPLRWKEPAGGGFIWQSAMETGVLREFLSDVTWGELDYLLVDVPPGTDKIRRLLELVPKLGMAVVVTTPGEMARRVVARSVRMIREARVPALGLVANMTEFLCPDCGGTHPLFKGDGAERLARECELEIWAHLPFDPLLGEATDGGRPASPDSRGARAFEELADRVEGETP